MITTSSHHAGSVTFGQVAGADSAAQHGSPDSCCTVSRILDAFRDPSFGPAGASGPHLPTSRRGSGVGRSIPALPLPSGRRNVR